MNTTDAFNEWLDQCPYHFEVTDEMDDCVFLFVRNPYEDKDK